MKNKNNMLELLTALSDDLSAEDLRLAAIASDLAVQLTAKRIGLGLTQSEFADLLGKSQTTVSKWENADCNFQIKTLVEIAQKLDLPLTISFKEPEPKRETYVISPTPAATAASSGKYIGAMCPASSWSMEKIV